MSCLNCDKKAVIELQHGNLCRTHFLAYFEDKVFKTIKKYNLIIPKDKICIATSGGKDSLTVLYLAKKYCELNNLSLDCLFALAIDEGIENYRSKTLEDLKQFCKEHKIILNIISNKEEFGKTLDEAYPVINEGTKKKPCNVCGVWRRYLLNKYARNYGANKVVTGHNLDDEAQAIMMNIFKANTKLAGRLGPVSGEMEHDLFVQRVKPLYFCTDKEVRLYTLLKGFKIQFAECPYSHSGYRYQIQKMLNDFESKFKGTKQGIIKSFLSLLPHLENSDGQEIKVCVLCHEAANQDICNACKMKEVIQND
ncbi:MAG TPA: TIGR00269 family protein [Candidatus Nanoarchaeia archaeon]|nr:TIGR00269 family protein [Candidatus Nanoarchaeia archaeon]